MSSDSLHHALDQALSALAHISKDEVQHLTLLECAFLLDTLPTIADSTTSTSTYLAEHLCRQLNPAWIRKGDLLEVFLVLEVLWKYNSLHVSGEHLAYALQRLVQSEVRVGGPYASNGIIDIPANLQIASFVQVVAKPLPGLDTFFDQVITEAHFEDATPGSPYTLYLFAKLYNRHEITHLIGKHRLNTPAHRAVALTTIKHEAPPLQQELRAVCSSQQSTGFWPAETLLNGRLTSRVATTALIVKSLIGSQSDTTSAKIPSDLQQRHRLVASAAKQLFETYTEPLRRSTLTAVDKICNVERNFEITLLSYYFAKALKHPPSLTDQQFTMLGAANVCGWVAYAIYDNLLDDEGDPSQLPVANVTMRASLDCFRAVLPPQRTFERYIANTFTEMDEANAWEVNNCRFIVRDGTVTIAQLPKYGRQTILAARSFAHALGPMAILINSMSTPQQTHCIESAFRHYLIARQLSDDLHDWKNDMEAGQASYVVIAILRDMHMQSGSYDLAVLLSGMQKQFRRTTMPHVCLLALRHISKAKQSFIRSKLLQAPNNIYTLLDELERSLRYSLDQHAKAKALVKTRVSYSS